MDIKTFATLLFVTRMASIIFIVMVLFRQYRLFKSYVQPELIAFRRALFVLALIILAGSIVDLGIDFLTFTDSITRTTNHVNPVGIVYASNNVVIADLSSILIWVLYRMAARVLIYSDKEIADAKGKEVE